MMKYPIVIAILAAFSIVTCNVQAAQSGVIFLSTNTNATSPGKFFCNVKNAQPNTQVSLANHDVVLQGIPSGGILPTTADQLKQFYLIYYHKSSNDPLGPHVNFNLIDAPSKVSITCIDNSTGGRLRSMSANFNVATR